MPRHVLGWNLLAWGERATVLRAGVEQLHRRLGARRLARHERRPHRVDPVASIDSDRRSILRTPVEHPPILTDTSGLGEGLAAVARLIDIVVRGDVDDVRILRMQLNDDDGVAAIAADEGKNEKEQISDPCHALRGMPRQYG